jgi:hypothetical protein
MALNMNKKEIAWLAGFIDGEGYIGITFQRKKENHRQSASVHYHPYLIITSNNLEILKEIKKLTGFGHVYKLSRNIEHHKQGFQYKLTEMEKLNILLPLLQPYLRLKQCQCELLISFINIRKNAKRIYGPYRGASSYTTEEEIYQKLRILNKRGLLNASLRR